MGLTQSARSPPFEGNFWPSPSDDEDDSVLETTGGAEKREAAGATTADGQASEAGPKKAAAPWPTDLCGLEYYPDAKVWEGPQRIRTSRLNEEGQTKCRQLLERIFCEQTVMGKKASHLVFTPDELTFVVDAVIPLLESEPTLIEDVPFDVTVVGDLHGQLYDLNRVFKIAAKDGKPGWECMSYVFLGNYVDRGRQSIEVVVALFCIKCLYPNKIFLLRGEHEFYKTNLVHGLSDDFREKYTVQETAKSLYLLLNEAFSWLSIAAIVGNTYFCANGGIAACTRRQMRGIYKPIIYWDDDTIIRDIIFSDPAVGLKGSTFNQARGRSIYFGYDELCKTLASMEVVAVIRGHSTVSNGFVNMWNTCFTVFSATDHQQTENDGAIVYVNPTGKLSFTILKVDKKRAEWERRLRAIEYLPDGTKQEKPDDRA